jgi:hypothetical protein
LVIGSYSYMKYNNISRVGDTPKYKNHRGAILHLHDGLSHQGNQYEAESFDDLSKAEATGTLRTQKELFKKL